MPTRLACRRSRSTSHLPPSLLSAPSPTCRKRVFDGMKASDALNEAQARQLAYDLGQALDGFRDRLDKLIGKRAE